MLPDFMHNSSGFMAQLQSALEMFLFLMIEISVLFVAISALVGVINQKLPAEKVQALLGGRHGKGYILAAGLGAITPFCSCSTIPMLIGLLKARAGFGPTMTFLITSPLLNPIVIALFIPVFGLQVTLVYAAIALGVALVAGMLLQRFGFERYVRTSLLENESEAKSCCDEPEASGKAQDTPTVVAMAANAAPATDELTPNTGCCGDKPKEEAKTSCCSKTEPAPEPAEKTSCCAKPEPEAKTACCSKTEPAPEPAEKTSCCSKAEPAPVEKTACCGGASQKAKSKIDWRKAWQESTSMYREMFPYMAIAMVLGALVHGFVPTDFFAEVAGADNPMAIPAAAVIGIPLYIRVTALLPLVGSLVAKGVSLGAVMALTIGAGGASIPELIMLKRLFRWQLLSAFVTVILFMAVGGGIVFNMMV